MTDKRISKHPSGITLLLVVVVLSLVSSIAIAITLLIVRQFEQGADVKGSMYAQNAADSGVEEIMYKVKSARSGSPSAFVDSLANEFGCKTTGGKIIEGSSFCTDEGQSYETEDEAIASLAENETLTVDMYDPEYDPLNPSPEITAIHIEGSTDSDTWLEVTWAAWDSSDGSFTPIGSSTKQIFKGSELQPNGRYVYMKKTHALAGSDFEDVYFLNNPLSTGDCTQDLTDVDGCFCTTNNSTAYPECKELQPGDSSRLNFVVRIKALYGNASEIRVQTMKNCIQQTGVAGCEMVPIPARVSIKVIGENNSLEQAVRISIPWRFATAGLFDYVLLAQESLIKLTGIVPTFYSTGTVEAEKGLEEGDYSPIPLPNILPNIPYNCVLMSNGLVAGSGGGTICGNAGATNWGIVVDDTGISAEAYTAHVRCQKEYGFDVSGDATCGFDMTHDDGSPLPNPVTDFEPPRITYDLSGYDLGETNDLGVLSQKSYYVNARFRVTSESENEAVNVAICDKSTGTCYGTGVMSGSSSPTQWFDEEQVPGSYGSADAPYYHKNENGWVVCSRSYSLTSEKYLQFRANDAYTTEASPRLDWWNISTIPFTEQAGICQFVADWEYDETEFAFRPAETLPLDDTTDDEYWCCQNWDSTLDSPEIAEACDQEADAHRCSTYSSPNLRIRDYFGYSDATRSQMLCSAWNRLGPLGSYYYKFLSQDGCVIVAQHVTGTSGKIAYAIPIEEFLSPGHIADGDYYVSVDHNEVSADQKVAIRPVYSRTDACALYGYCDYAQYFTYLESLVNSASYDPAHETTVARSNRGGAGGFATPDFSWAPGSNTDAPTWSCYFPDSNRVKPGDSVIVLVDGTTSAQTYNYYSITNIHLTQEVPTDAYGDALPEC